MKTFKQFLITEEVVYTIYKPKTSGRYVLGWGTQDYSIEIHRFPVSQVALKKMMSESGSVRLTVEPDGTILVWKGGVLHNNVYEQEPKIKPYLNLVYDDGCLFIDFSKEDYVPIERIQTEARSKSDFFIKLFDRLKEMFPGLEVVGCENKMSMDYPFDLI